MGLKGLLNQFKQVHAAGLVIWPEFLLFSASSADDLDLNSATGLGSQWEVGSANNVDLKFINFEEEIFK